MIESRKDKGRLLGICTLVGCLPFMSCVAVAAAQEVDPEAGALDYVKAIEEGRVEQLRVGRIMLGYGVDPTSPPVEGAELFYTTDEGRSWSEFLLDNPIANPISFNASDDGLYGFSFVLHSARGSMPRPRAGAVPQRWVMVDRGAPHITMRNLQTPSAGVASRELVVGWLVTDPNNNLGQRPVSISYRITSGGDARAKPIARALEAIGEYRWIIPMNITGDIVIRIEAEDRAGNRDYLETRSFTIERAPNAGSMVHVNRTISLASVRDDAQKAETTSDASPVVKTAEKSQPDQVVSAFALLNDDKEKEIVVEKEAAERARKEYDLGTWHRLRGEYDIAIRRYRDALAANPGYYQARNDLAGTLLALDRIDEASDEYERILEKDERYAPALEGLSLAQIKRRRYRSAHDTLERLLRVRPKDPEAWLHFGDVCMFMGDRRGARDAWRSATECDRAAASLKSRAERRLAIYQRDRLGAAD